MHQPLRIALIGHQFMGKAHSHAYRDVHAFFPHHPAPVCQVICGRRQEPLQTAADRWGWAECSTDWQAVIRRDDIDLVDIATPQHVHCEMAVAAAEAGKHILLEKPMALNAAEARTMLDAVNRAGVKHMMVFNYRRAPAVQLARQLIDEGRIGDIFHWRGWYLQDRHIDPQYPLKWKHRKEIAGSGAHGDLNAHLIDLARYLVGEITTVQGMTHTFIPERPFPPDRSSLAGVPETDSGLGAVTVDDTTLFLAEFANGARGSFEASRFANGRKNYNCFEINGSRGSLRFDFERMNELEFYSSDESPATQGFRKILVTDRQHPYMDAWWPAGHIIGYEHTFVNQVADLLECIEQDQMPTPNFYDGWKNQEVLDAVLASAESGRRVDISLENNGKTDGTA
jgi:predicted dehydrogenase